MMRLIRVLKESRVVMVVDAGVDGEVGRLLLIDCDGKERVSGVEWGQEVSVGGLFLGDVVVGLLL